MEVRLLKLEMELIVYSNNYQKITLTPIPLEYLKNNLVYGFFKNGEQLAGFVIGINPPFRTLELFAPKESHGTLMSFLNGGKEVCEVCCFWELREKITFMDNAIIWFNMSQKVRVKGKKFFLGGTYIRGLANLYGYPSFAPLISHGVVNGKEAWIFIAWRKYSVLSAIQVMSYKTKKMFLNVVGKKMPNYIKSVNQKLVAVANELKAAT